MGNRETRRAKRGTTRSRCPAPAHGTARKRGAETVATMRGGGAPARDAAKGERCAVAGDGSAAMGCRRFAALYVAWEHREGWAR